MLAGVRETLNIFELRHLCGIVSMIQDVRADISGLEVVLSGFFGSMARNRTGSPGPRKALKILKFLDRIS